MLGRTPRTWPLLVVVPSVALAATLALARPQEPKERAKADAKPEAKEQAKVDVEPGRYFGATYCSGCHANPDNPAYKESLGHVKLNEFVTWKNEDKHAVAYTMLGGERGKAMAARLGMDVTKKETGCLGCHSASPSEAKDRVTAAWTPADGVSCENCHGPGEKWLTPHSIAEWRDKSPEFKATLGMNDLRDPIRQADKCLSCHVGKAEEGKVVTHAMYAVGHPPLPSIDVTWFSDAIPRHWRLLSEKPDSTKPVHHKKDAGLERSRLAMVGAGMALKTSMKLMADETRVKDSKTPGHGWPDYARFDCASCHHELERPSWRQERGYDGPPGRPPVNRWPLALLSIGIDRLMKDDPTAKGLLDELKAHEAALNATTQARPFGRKADLAKAADSFATWADALTVRLAKATYDAKAVKEMVTKLVAEASDADLDYESARYVAWTSSSFLRDLGRYPLEDAALKPVFERLVKGLHLDLPTGQKYKIEEVLPGALRTMGDYDPRRFRADLKELLPLIGQ